MWAGSTMDLRALQKAAGLDRIAAAWQTSNFFTIDLNLVDGKTHQLALYCLDWDSSTRSQRIEIVDAANGVIIDSRKVSNFSGGKYLIWNMTGHVIVRINRTVGAKAVLSGLFFK
jgi:hypothetical protein